MIQFQFCAKKIAGEVLRPAFELIISNVGLRWVLNPSLHYLLFRYQVTFTILI